MDIIIKRSIIDKIMRSVEYCKNNLDINFSIFLKKNGEIYGKSEKFGKMYLCNDICLYSFKIPKYERCRENEPYPKDPTKEDVSYFIQMASENDTFFPTKNNGMDRFNTLVHCLRMWDDGLSIAELNAQFENIILDYGEWYYKQYIDSERDYDYETDEAWLYIWRNRSKIREDIKMIWPGYMQAMDSIRCLEEE